MQKLLAAPKFALAALCAVFVPRNANRWIFGSGIGVAEGALAVARELRDANTGETLVWVVANDAEAELAEAEGFRSVLRHSWAGFWATLRAGQIVVTHGPGDVNRFGIFGGRVVYLIHGAPLKKMHLDSPVTTGVTGPALLRTLLMLMYRASSKHVSLIVAGSVTAAQRLRSAYRVEPGKVLVLGDPRDDSIFEQLAHPELIDLARAEVLSMLGLTPADGQSLSLVLYAPTWRDGEPDPAVPSEAEIAHIRATLESLNAHLVIRSHPLGAGEYAALLGERVHELGSQRIREITPYLAAFDAVITDYSSIALDFALFSRPILWFAPDLDHYNKSRGLYEPLEVTAAGHVHTDWDSTMRRLGQVLPEGSARNSAIGHSRELSKRFHAFPEGHAAARVLQHIRGMAQNIASEIPDGAVFFESYYGRQASCNPLAIDREIAARFPDRPRYWSVENELVEVPSGATAVLIGSQEWHAVRRAATLLVVNDWLRFNFRRRRHQTVLQTWHGTMLKHLALSRPRVSARTRLAIRRESRRWSLMLSQNAHSTEHFRQSYAFRGEILELGYPRDDRLAAATSGNDRIGIAVDTARRNLGIPRGKRVLAFAPTWREVALNTNSLDAHSLAQALGDDWIVLVRAHTRSAPQFVLNDSSVMNVSTHPDVNDVILAADVLVTDYSSVMFDAAVARVPMIFYVPDLDIYRDRERGFTFDFEALAPGPLVTTPEELVRAALEGPKITPEYETWCARFVPHDDGHASARVVDALVARGAL